MLKWLTSFFAWLQIAVSPLLIGFIMAFIIYIAYPTKLGLIIAIVIASLGIAIGAVIATRIWKKRAL